MPQNPSRSAGARGVLIFRRMCGRSSLHDAPVSVLAQFGLPPVLPGFEARYNIAPTQDQWTISLNADSRPEAKLRRWGLVPSWASDAKSGSRMINARAESLADKPSWSELLDRRRCLVLADGYYEWTGKGKSRTPYFFHLAGNEAFAFAGLWDRWERDGEPMETCTIVTVDASKRVAAYHHRMPALLDTDAAMKWISPSSSRREVLSLLRPYENADLECYEVSKFVNSPANESPECIVPAGSAGGLSFDID